MTSRGSKSVFAQWWMALGNPPALGNTVLALACGGFVVRSIWVGGIGASLGVGLRIAIALLNVAVLIVSVLLARVVASRPVAGRIGRAWLAIAAYGIASMVTGLINTVVIQPLRGDVVSSAMVRSVVGTISLLCIVLLVDQRDRQLRAVSELIEQQRRLSQVRSAYQQSLNWIRSRLVTIVDDKAGTALRQSISTLRSMRHRFLSATEIAGAAGLIRANAEGVVRELGHSLDSGVPPETLPVLDGVADQRNDRVLRKGRSDGFGQLVKDGLINRPFWPGPLASVLAIGAANMSIPLVGFVSTLIVTVIVSAVTWAGVSLGQRFIASRMRSMPFAVAVLVVVLVYASCAFGSIYLVDQVLYVQNLLAISLTLTFGLTAMAIALAVYDGTERARRRCLEDLTYTLEAISWEVARLADDELTVRREIALLLHGNTQGRLTAVAMQLDQIARQAESGIIPSDSQVQLAIDSSIETLQQAADEIASLSTREQIGLVSDLASALSSIASSWRSIAVITIDCPREVLQRISTSRSVTTAAAQAARESITNAIRHGGADRIDIVMRLVGSAVEIRVLDNGSGLQPGYVPGLGLASMERAGGSVRLTSPASGGAELLVRLPIG